MYLHWWQNVEWLRKMDDSNVVKLDEEIDRVKFDDLFGGSRTMNVPLVKKKRVLTSENVITHPLDGNLSQIDTTNGKNQGTNNDDEDKANLPNVQWVNMNDLNMSDIFDDDRDLNKCDPIYTRIRSEQEGQNNKVNNQNFFNKQSRMRKEFEMESWHMSHDVEENLNELLLPNKRSRQTMLNPLFLKVYALETSCKQNKLLPEVYIDDDTLQNINTAQLQSLDKDVQMAIWTKRKLYMSHVQRNDLYGTACPWNLKFVPHHDSLQRKRDDLCALDTQSLSSASVTSRSTQQSTSAYNQTTKSLVRLNSDITPWELDPTTSPSPHSRKMLQPCGRLNTRTQYVVHGWCDARFA